MNEEMYVKNLRLWQNVVMSKVKSVSTRVFKVFMIIN